MQTLVVTGASRGLGAHICRRASEAGFRIVGLARKVPADAAYEIRSCDVSDPEQVAASLSDLKSDTSLYGLINAAGIASMNLTIATPADTARRIVGVNLLGTIHCSALIGKFLARRKRGRIINFSTIAVSLGLKGEAVYAASKAGVEGFSRAFAREMADFDVTVNTIAPGPIDTDLIAKVPSEKIDAIIERQIRQVKAAPEDVWNIVSLLLRPESDAVTGAILHVHGA